VAPIVPEFWDDKKFSGKSMKRALCLELANMQGLHITSSRTMCKGCTLASGEKLS